MKKLIVFFLAATSLGIGCDKNKTESFLESIDLRVDKAVKEYREILLSNDENGWIGTLKTGSGRNFEFNFVFKENNLMEMSSDISISAIRQPQQSLYAVRAVEKPTLVFETFNYIHLPANPAADAMGGTRGHGLRSDVEFEILKYEDGVLHLRGLKYRNELLISKADVSYVEKHSDLLDKFDAGVALFGQYTSYPIVLADNTLAEFRFNEESADLQLFKFSTDNISTGTMIPISTTLTPDGFVFGTVTVGGVTFKDVLIDPVEDRLYTMRNNVKTFLDASVVSNYIGFHTDKKFYRINTKLEALTDFGVASDFDAVLSAVLDNLKSQNLTVTNAYADIWNASGTHRFYLYINTSGGNFTWNYTATYTGDQFTLTGTGTKSAMVTGTYSTIIKPIDDYLEKRNFRLVWLNSEATKKMTVGFHPVGEPTNIFFGTAATSTAYPVEFAP